MQSGSREAVSPCVPGYSSFYTAVTLGLLRHDRLAGWCCWGAVFYLGTIEVIIIMFPPGKQVFDYYVFIIARVNTFDST